MCQLLSFISKTPFPKKGRVPDRNFFGLVEASSLPRTHMMPIEEGLPGRGVRTGQPQWNSLRSVRGWVRVRPRGHRSDLGSVLTLLFTK